MSRASRGVMLAVAVALAVGIAAPGGALSAPALPTPPLPALPTPPLPALPAQLPALPEAPLPDPPEPPLPSRHLRFPRYRFRTHRILRRGRRSRRPRRRRRRPRFRRREDRRRCPRSPRHPRPPRHRRLLGCRRRARERPARRRPGRPGRIPIVPRPGSPSSSSSSAESSSATGSGSSSTSAGPASPGGQAVNAVNQVAALCQAMARLIAASLDEAGFGATGSVPSAGGRPPQAVATPPAPQQDDTALPADGAPRGGRKRFCRPARGGHEGRRWHADPGVRRCSRSGLGRHDSARPERTHCARAGRWSRRSPPLGLRPRERARRTPGSASARRGSSRRRPGGRQPRPLGRDHTVGPDAVAMAVGLRVADPGSLMAQALRRRMNRVHPRSICRGRRDNQEVVGRRCH